MGENTDSTVHPEPPAVSAEEFTTDRLKVLSHLLRLRAELSDAEAGRSRGGLKSVLFDKQLTVSNCQSKVFVMLCGRRAGKSFFAAFWLTEGCFLRPGSLNLFVTITRDNARLIVWPELKRLDDELGLGMVFNETLLEVKVPNGATIMLRGCKDRPSVERFRGPKFFRIFADECGSFPPYLRDLYATIRPATIDLDGEFCFGGTPGIQFQGYWFEMSGPEGDPRTKRTYPVFEWTMFENPHLPHAKRVAQEIKDENGWSDTHPTWVREYLGKWVEDESDLVIPFNVERNGITALPTHDPITHVKIKWNYVLAIDYGYEDNCAFVVLAYCKQLPEVYTVRSWKENQMLTHDIARQIRLTEDKCPGLVTVMDYGASKGIAEEIRRRYGVPIRPAEKRERSANIRLLRSEVLAQGRRRIVTGGGVNDPLLDEVAVLRFNEDHSDVDDGQEDHCFDAWMYGDRECRKYSHVESELEPEYGTIEWQKRERDRIIAKRKSRAEGQVKQKFWQR